MDNKPARLAKVVELTITQAGHKVAAVGDDQWENATPCTEWNVRDLTAHMVEELLWIPPILEGKDLGEAQQRIEARKPFRNLQSIWEEAAPRAIGAVHHTDPEHPVEISSGTVPARQFLEEITIDMTIHTWDLAQSLGIDTTLEGQLVDTVYELLSEKVEEWRAEGAFGEAIEVGADASTQTKLLALVGRAG